MGLNGLIIMGSAIITLLDARFVIMLPETA
jgi:hypothetical protein